MFVTYLLLMLSCVFLHLVFKTGKKSKLKQQQHLVLSFFQTLSRTFLFPQLAQHTQAEEKVTAIDHSRLSQLQRRLV